MINLNENVKLCENLRKLRKKARLTQQQLADAIGVNRSAYAYYETGKSEPKLETLKKIAKVLNISIDELVNGDDTRSIASMSPSYNDIAPLDEKLNSLSTYEKNIILRVRMMSTAEKEELRDFLCRK